MPKRSCDERIEYYNAKIRKLQNRKIDRKHRRLIVYSSDSEENVERNQTPKPVPDAHSASPSPPPKSLSPEPSPPPTAEPPLPPPVHELDPELLQALGEASTEIPVYGPPIHDTLAQRWLPILQKGLKLNIKEGLLKAYAIPDNCKLLKSPILNPEISAAVTDAVRSRDKKILERQNQLGFAITAINRAMTLLLTGEDKVQSVKILSDSCRMLTDLHFINTQMRIKLITPGLEKSFSTLIQDQERDETLFGTTLAEKIKASKAIERQGLQIKKSIPKASSADTSSSLPRGRPQGNWSAPPRHQPSSRGGRTLPYRSQYRRASAAPASTLRPAARTYTSAPPPGQRRAPFRP